jgi:hypothetical protein
VLRKAPTWTCQTRVASGAELRAAGAAEAGAAAAGAAAGGLVAGGKLAASRAIRVAKAGWGASSRADESAPVVRTAPVAAASASAPTGHERDGR